MKEQAAHNAEADWLSLLLSPGIGQREAAASLLASGTLPQPDVNAWVGGVPVLGRTYVEHDLWTGLVSAPYAGQYRDWPENMSALPLSNTERWPEMPALPDAFGQVDRERALLALSRHEGLFARLLALGADPWVSWMTPRGEADGFDIAVGWNCLPLMDACLRHPSSPPVTQLHGRHPWRLARAPAWTAWTDATGRPVLGEHDTLVQAAAAADALPMLRWLLAKGWDPNPRKGWHPLALARSKKVIDLLAAGGSVVEQKPTLAAQWRRLAQCSKPHSKTLHARLGALMADEGAVSLAQLAVDTWRKSDVISLQGVLEKLDPTLRERKGPHHVFDGDPDRPDPETRVWTNMPAIQTTAKLARANPVSPLVLVSAIALSGHRPRLTRRAVDLLSQVACYYPDTRLIASRPEVTPLGLASLLFALASEQELSRYSPRSFRKVKTSLFPAQSTDEQTINTFAEMAQAVVFFVQYGSAAQAKNARQILFKTARDMRHGLLGNERATPPTIAQEAIENALPSFRILGIPTGLYETLQPALKNRTRATQIAWGVALVRGITLSNKSLALKQLGALVDHVGVAGQDELRALRKDIQSLGDALDQYASTTTDDSAAWRGLVTQMRALQLQQVMNNQSHRTGCTAVRARTRM